MLLSDVNCNQSHSELSQCVHPPLGIHMHDCDQENTAGVICTQLVSSSTTSDVSTLHASTAYLTPSILGAAAVCTVGTITFIAVVIVMVVVTRKRIRWNKNRIMYVTQLHTKQMCTIFLERKLCGGHAVAYLQPTQLAAPKPWLACIQPFERCHLHVCLSTTTLSLGTAATD